MIKSIIYNTDYFLKETRLVIKLKLLSNIITAVSIGLIFFVLSLTLSGWKVSSYFLNAVREEAEINVYFNENLNEPESLKVADAINNIEGVKDAVLIGKTEAYERMSRILGKDTDILEFFDENPFSSFIEVKIDLDRIEPIIEEIKSISGIESVRNNREILDRLHDISEALRLLGVLIAASVAIATLVIVSHIIKLGIQSNREQINTLSLLGAPWYFISLPFLLSGLLIVLAGGLIAALLSVSVLTFVYDQISGFVPFIPLPPRESLMRDTVLSVLLISALLGFTGSAFGLKSSGNN